MGEQQIASIEASLARLSQLMPAMPTQGVLFLRLVSLLAHQIDTMLEHHIRPHGLGEGEFRVLASLYSQPDGTAHPGDLCTRAAKSPANMSRITDALVERGLITRVPSEEDRRRWVLGITDKGAALVRRALPDLHDPVRQMCAGLSEREMQRMIGHLKQCILDLEGAMAGAGVEAGA